MNKIAYKVSGYLNVPKWEFAFIINNSNNEKKSQSSLRKPKVFALQILQRYLTKEGRVRKFSTVYMDKRILLSKIKGLEGLERSKLLGISQTVSFSYNS